MGDVNPHPEIPQVRDKRPTISGLLPKNAQARVLGGIALLMIVVILLSGRNTPKERPAPTAPVIDPSELRIQDYRTHIQEQAQKLAAEERELARTKDALGVHPTETLPAPSPRPSGYPAAPLAPEAVQAKTWVEIEKEKREYQGLFASNIALSYRAAPSHSGLDTATPAPVSTVASEPARSSQRTGVSSPDTALSPGMQEYRLFEGTAIETVLTNRLDSTFSGPVNCMVTTNVYSHEGPRLLIPQGTRILGEVRKLGGFGEQRLAVFFHRMIMPDGFSVNLDKFQGLDQIGETGLRDQVNHHYLQIFGVSVAIGAFAGLAQANTHYNVDESGAAAYEQGVTNSLSQSALHILDRYLNVLPTFTIREGYRVKVYLSQDLMLPAYDQHPARIDLEVFKIRRFRMRRKLVFIALGLAICAAPALAILGIGDIVFDPTNYEEAIQEFLQLEQQYNQLVQTYNLIQNQYQQMLWMAQQVPVSMGSRYRALSIPWTPSSATNTYGTTGGWTLGINTGQGVSNGYSSATESLGAYGSALGNIPSDQLSRVKTSYATVELTDGANLAGMQTIGQLRGNASAVEMAIQSLENDSLSSDPNMNTEIAVLNKINAANVINLRNTQDTNKLLTALAEEQIIQAKRQRDAEAQSFNDHIQFMTSAQAVMAAQSANASSAMLAWRMP